MLELLLLFARITLFFAYSSMAELNFDVYTEGT